MAADLALIGARIRTLDPARPWATAVAIKDGVIVAVGDDATVRDACDGKTTVIDGAGMHVTPGLTDPHFHPFLSSDATVGADLTQVRTLDELRAALAEEHRRVGPDAWVRGWGLVFEVFAATGIHGDLVANATGGAPTFVTFFDYHNAVASPSALAIAGVTGSELFVDFSTVVVDELGAPTGELRENGAMDLIRAFIPERTPEEKRRNYIANMRIWNSLGLTGVHAMDGKPETYDLLRQLEGDGDLTIRMRSPLWIKPDMTMDDMRAWAPLKTERGRRWQGGTAKFFIDGTIEGGTAWLVEPDTEGAGTQPFWPDPAHYTAAVNLFAKAGFQCVTHAVGDMAVRHTLDAYEAAGPVPDAMHRVEHIELLQDVDLPRFARLGVAASMQPLHMAMFDAAGDDQWSRLVGPERRKLAFRTRDLLASGATLALGSDWGVAPYDPRLGMAWARLRRTPGRPERGPIEPRQCLTGLETLAGYTAAAARVVSEQAIAGMIQEGCRADLSAFAADLVETPADDLLTIPTLLTVVDGDVVYQAD
jgi:predicted amidohydrolase YtcJ